MFQLGSRSSRAAAPPAVDAPPAAPSLEALRRQARRRLIGAAVLVGAAVIVLPWLLEAQPRPVPVDVAIEIPSRDAAAPLPAATAASGPVDELAQELVLPSARPSAATPMVEDRAWPSTESKPAAAAPAAPAPARPQPSEGDSVAAPTVAAVPMSAAPTEAAKVRVVVQVGAYAEAARAQEVRRRLESAGLKTYTHVADTPQGKRIRVRVGPFDSRAEAEKVAEKVKALGLPAAVLTL